MIPIEREKVELNIFGRVRDKTLVTGRNEYVQFDSPLSIGITGGNAMDRIDKAKARFTMFGGVQGESVISGQTSSGASDLSRNSSSRQPPITNGEHVRDPRSPE
jgi:hypothetical protein